MMKKVRQDESVMVKGYVVQRYGVHDGIYIGLFVCMDGWMNEYITITM